VVSAAHPGASEARDGAPETFEAKMAALTGGGGMAMDERDPWPAGGGDVGGGGVSGGAAPEQQQGLADYASRRAAVPLVLLRRRR
jgi:hypothetical protein